jgi:ribonuclease P protein component
MNTLPKSEILSKRDEISALMKDGKSFAKHPIRVVYHYFESETPQVKVFFSAPKRNFKRAVDRNRIKRLMKEAYRLNKIILSDTARASGKTIHVAFLFTGREVPVYKEVQDKIILLLQRFQTEIQSGS